MCTLSRIATLPLQIKFTLNIYALSEDDSMGIRILKLRKLKNLTAEKLGEKTGLTGTRIINYENENAYPSRNVLLKLVSIFGEDVLCDDYSKFITSDYGPTIKEWRLNNNYTCEQAAIYIGTTKRTLHTLESMTNIISRKNFEQYKNKLMEILLI